MNALRDLPSIKDQTAFNLERWDELCADPFWADIDGKIETDRYGQVLMNLPAEPGHGGHQADLSYFLRVHAPAGKVLVECPVSTSEGMKVPDVVWVSAARRAQIARRTAFSAAPEICVEVLSPSNTRNEIEEKRRLYFEAGAKEVWICERSGRMRFFLRKAPAVAAEKSVLCPRMPVRLPD
jgi:Uma2 family endonuclease